MGRQLAVRRLPAAGTFKPARVVMRGSFKFSPVSVRATTGPQFKLVRVGLRLSLPLALTLAQIPRIHHIRRGGDYFFTANPVRSRARHLSQECDAGLRLVVNFWVLPHGKN